MTKEYFDSSVLLEAYNESRNIIGKYLILEDFYPEDNAEVKIEKSPRTGKPVGHAIFQSGNARNRNGRIYVTEDLGREISCPRTIELLRTGNLFCEAGHPIDTSLQRQSTIDWRNANCKILNLEMQGNDVVGNFTPSNNALGEAFSKDLVVDHMIPAFSLRALGSIKQTRLGAQVTDLRFITYDQVIYPSHSNAYMTELVSESATSKLINEAAPIVALFDEIKEANNLNKIVPIGKLDETDSAAVVDFVKNNSNNLKFVNEYFDFKYDKIEINDKGTRVILKEAGCNNILSVNIESYIHNELMNYNAKIAEMYRQ